MLTQQIILSRLKHEKRRLFKLYPLKSLALVGSFARNEATEKSDVDVLVEFNGEMGLKFIDLCEDLERILQNKVDLLSLRALKPHARDGLIKEMIDV